MTTRYTARDRENTIKFEQTYMYDGQRNCSPNEKRMCVCVCVNEWNVLRAQFITLIFCWLAAVAN